MARQREGMRVLGPYEQRGGTEYRIVVVEDGGKSHPRLYPTLEQAIDAVNALNAQSGHTQSLAALCHASGQPDQNGHGQIRGANNSQVFLLHKRRSRLGEAHLKCTTVSMAVAPKRYTGREKAVSTNHSTVVSLTAAVCLCVLGACASDEGHFVQLQVDSVGLSLSSLDEEDEASLAIDATLTADEEIGFALVAVERIGIFESPTPDDSQPLVKLMGDFELGFDRSFEGGQNREAQIVGIGNTNADLMPLCGDSYLIHVCVEAVASHASHTATCDWRDEVPINCP